MERKKNQSSKGGARRKRNDNKQLAEILDKDPAVISKWVTKYCPAQC